VLETRPIFSDQDQDQDRHWSETGLVIRPWSQTTTLTFSSVIYLFNI